MKAAIETSKHVHIKMLQSMWQSSEKIRLITMLHGFCMFSSADLVGEKEAYEEMVFLRDLAGFIREVA